MLYVELTNCSSSTQSVRDLLPVEFGLLSVWKRGPGSKAEELYYSPVRREGRGRRSVEVPPGGALTALVPVYLDSTGWNLSEIGDYQFRAQYQVLETVLDAQPVKVHISAPKGELVTAARDFMRPQAARFFLLEGGDAAGREVMLSISSRFPRSPWASYAELSLAIDDTASAAQAKKLDNCKRLEAATRQVPDWIIALRGYRALFSCLRETGQAESARKVAQEFVTRNPKARNARELRIE